MGMSGIDEQIKKVPKCSKCHKTPDFWTLKDTIGWSLGNIYNNFMIREYPQQVSLGLFYETIGGVDAALKTNVRIASCSACGYSQIITEDSIITKTFRERLKNHDGV